MDKKVKGIYSKYNYIIKCKATRDFNFNEEETRDVACDVHNRIKKLLIKNQNANINKSWIRLTAKSACIDLYRKQIRSRKKEIRKQERVIYKKWLGKDKPDDCVENKPEEMMIKQELSAFLHKSLDNLRPKTREIMTLRINGCKYHEIAEKMNISINTVKTAIYRAKEQLSRQTMLNKMFKEYLEI